VSQGILNDLQVQTSACPLIGCVARHPTSFPFLFPPTQHAPVQVFGSSLFQLFAQYAEQYAPPLLCFVCAIGAPPSPHTYRVSTGSPLVRKGVLVGLQVQTSGCPLIGCVSRHPTSTPFLVPPAQHAPVQVVGSSLFQLFAQYAAQYAPPLLPFV